MGKLGKPLKWIFLVLGVIIAAGVLGYLKFFTWNPERQKLALINQRSITVAQFSRELAKVPVPYQDMLREDPKPFVEQLIMKEILLQEAERQGIKADPNAKGEDAEMSMIQSLLKKEILDQVKVSQEEVEAIYRQHRDQMGKKALPEVAPLIENIIREAKGKEQVEEYVASLRKKAKVEISEKHLQAIITPSPQTDTAEEFKKAIQSGQPVLVDFGSNSCMPCRQIRPILKEVKQEYTGKAHVLVIDVYKFKELAGEYRVQLIPTLIFSIKKEKKSFAIWVPGINPLSLAS
jgi:thiol-disulfide isomerase/thioredoxin